jgi:hypothetical protein
VAAVATRAVAVATVAMEGAQAAQAKMAVNWAE